MTEQQEHREPPRSGSTRPPLRRSKDDRVIAGVCGGIARSLAIDPVIVRVLVAAFALAGGAGIIAYILAWIIIPDDRGQSVVDDARTHGGRGRQFVLAVLLAALGLGAIASLTGGNHGTVGFLIFVVIGIVIWQAFGSDWLDGGRWRTSEWVNLGQLPNGSERQQAAADAWVARKLEHRSVLGRLVFNVVLLAIGVMLMLNFANLTSLSTRSFIAVALAIVGLGLLISAFIGRARGLIALGLGLSLLTLPASVDARNVAGTRHWLPTASSGATATAYDLGMGDATLNLRTALTAMSPTDSLQVTAHVGVGQLLVLLPANVPAHYLLHLQDNVGDILYPGEAQRSGVNNEATVTIGDGTNAPTVNLDLRVDVGHLEVRYA